MPHRPYLMKLMERPGCRAIYTVRSHIVISLRSNSNASSNLTHRPPISPWRLTIRTLPPLHCHSGHTETWTQGCLRVINQFKRARVLCAAHPSHIHIYSLEWRWTRAASAGLMDFLLVGYIIRYSSIRWSGRGKGGGALNVRSVLEWMRETASKRYGTVCAFVLRGQNVCII